MTFDEKIQQFAKVLEDQQIARLWQEKLACPCNIENVRTKVVPGKKYYKVDVGTSGKYMVERDTEKIFGIKAYGVIHRGYQFGTLDTIDRYNWGGYRAYMKPAAKVLEVSA